MSRMRVLASTKVLATAEAALRRIIETYSETDVTFTDTNLRAMIQKGSFDLLHDFGEACREESDLFGQAILNDRTQNVRLRVFSALGLALGPAWRERPTGCSRFGKSRSRELGVDGLSARSATADGLLTPILPSRTDK
jgi:hypothetical protein